MTDDKLELANSLIRLELSEDLDVEFYQSSNLPKTMELAVSEATRLEYTILDIGVDFLDTQFGKLQIQVY